MVWAFFYWENYVSWGTTQLVRYTVFLPLPGGMERHLTVLKWVALWKEVHTWRLVEVGGVSGNCLFFHISSCIRIPQERRCAAFWREKIRIACAGIPHPPSFFWEPCIITWLGEDDSWLPCLFPFSPWWFNFFPCHFIILHFKLTKHYFL